MNAYVSILKSLGLESIEVKIFQGRRKFVRLGEVVAMLGFEAGDGFVLLQEYAHLFSGYKSHGHETVFRSGKLIRGTKTDVSLNLVRWRLQMCNHHHLFIDDCAHKVWVPATWAAALVKEYQKDNVRLPVYTTDPNSGRYTRVA